MIAGEKKRYTEVVRPAIKDIILHRLEDWYRGLERRVSYFMQLPHHVKGIQDLPDWGLYDYKPLNGKKSKFMTIQLTHYTDQQSYEAIKRMFQIGQKNVLTRDETGYAYFVDKPLPERLGVTELRTVLGTGLQSYIGKTRRRDPQVYVTIKIRVPKERVLTREETYTLHSGKKIKVKKYAIAGGVSLMDICKDEKPMGARYVYDALPQHAKNYQEYWKRSNTEK